MSPRARRLLIRGGFFVLAGVLLYLALRGADLDEVGAALREADYRWIAPLGIVMMLSHLVRAWRWQILLEALPAAQERARRVSLKTAFYSLMIGYMVNYALPRVGEVVRTADVAAHEKLSFSGVLGTVVVERILDALVLALGLVFSMLLLLDQSAALQEYFLTPFQAWLSQIPALTVLVVVLGLAVGVGLVYALGFRAPDAPLRRFWEQRLRGFLVSFKDGLATVVRSPRRMALVFSTVLMWVLYAFMAYIPIIMFGMAGLYSLSLLDGVVIMFLGAIGVAIPSPGGVGSYHYITVVTLVNLFGADASLAATYAVFVHGGQLVFFVVVGFLSMILQGSSLGSLRARTQAAQQDNQNAPPHGTPATE